MKLQSAVALVCAVVVIVVLPAEAATVTDLVTFSATGFTADPNPGSVPATTVSGSFTITFDPTKTYLDSTSGITLNSLNISLG
jgi:hypothetical protein